MKRVAITGGIASGKSTAAEYIKKLGYPVFSCDEIYKSVIQEQEYIQTVERYFPACVQDGKINRNILSKIIFDDSQKREQLNQIAHPLIMKELYKQMNECNSMLVFAEVPLLFEGGYENAFDNVIVIKRNYQDRIKDLMKRNQISKEEARKKIYAQFDYDSNDANFRFKSCEALLVQNEGSFTDLKKQIEDIILLLSR